MKQWDGIPENKLRVSHLDNKLRHPGDGKAEDPFGVVAHPLRLLNIDIQHKVMYGMSYEDHDKCHEREYELQEEINRLRNQVTYLQTELAEVEDQLREAQDKLAEYDEGFM